jgi:hypothetical protein
MVPTRAAGYLPAGRWVFHRPAGRRAGVFIMRMFKRVAVVAALSAAFLAAAEPVRASALPTPGGAALLAQSSNDSTVRIPRGAIKLGVFVVALVIGGIWKAVRGSNG